MLNLFLAIAAVTALHLLTMAAMGHAVGAQLLRISYGFGPALFTTGLFEIRALPIGGSVRFLHSVEDRLSEEEWPRALDRLSVPAQLLVVLSGCALLLGLAVALQGRAGIDAFLALPAQWLTGVISPLGDAQALLQRIAAFAESAPFAVILALLAAKVAALNLLPLPYLNGGAALAVLGRRLGLARWWPAAATRAAVFAWMAVLVLWLVALGGFILGA
ncbi:site-2 protease family protein [Roseateles sp. P5_E4]